MSEGNDSDVARNVTSQFLNEILNDWSSASYINTGFSEFKTSVSVSGWCV